MSTAGRWSCKNLGKNKVHILTTEKISLWTTLQILCNLYLDTLKSWLVSLEDISIKKNWEDIWHERQSHQRPSVAMVRVWLFITGCPEIAKCEKQNILYEVFSSTCSFPLIYFIGYFKRCALIYLIVLMFLEMKYKKLREEKGNSFSCLIDSLH